MIKYNNEVMFLILRLAASALFLSIPQICFGEVVLVSPMGSVAPLARFEIEIQSDSDQIVRVHLLSKTIEGSNSFSWVEVFLNKGLNNISVKNPLSGTYKINAPDGLLRSHKKVTGENIPEFYKDFYSKLANNQYVFVIEEKNKKIYYKFINIDYENLASETFLIQQKDFRGRIYKPKNIEKGPVIILIGGNPHRRADHFGFALAKHGFVVLHVIYHHDGGECFDNYPIESFVSAIKWIKSQNYTNPNLGVIGISRGAEAIPFIAKLYKSINYSVMINFSAWNLPAGCIFPASPWTIGKKSVSYLSLPLLMFESDNQAEYIKKVSVDTADKYKIPFKYIYMKTLLIGSKNDKLLPSYASVNIACEQIGCEEGAAGRKYEVNYAGHDIFLPPWITGGCDDGNNFDICENAIVESQNVYDALIGFITENSTKR